MCSIEDSLQPERTAKLLTAVVTTMFEHQLFYIATETCITLLVRMAKHYDAVREWMFDVRAPPSP